MNITFDKSAAYFILDAFGANVNAEGFILTKDGKYFPSINNEPVSINNFAGVINKDGKAVLVTKDIIGLINASDVIGY
jgi:hypothetical protein